MKQLIDLHIHSNLSDGELSPKEIIDKAIKNNVSELSITDHDTIDAYTEELYEYAKSKNINLINGVEISTKNEKAGIHVLGYNFDINNKALKEKLHLLKNARHIYLKDVSKKLIELGYKVNVEALDKIDVVTKAHIALDIVNNLENEEILLKEFGYIPSKGEFIETIMNEGCPAYIGKVVITPKEAADLIRQAGGKVVLAHPVAYQYIDGFTDKEILRLLENIDADGIEANYIFITQEKEKINDSLKWNEVAKNKDLFSTIGSDFHKEDGYHPTIGLLNENINLSKEEIEKIVNNLTNS